VDLDLAALETDGWLAIPGVLTAGAATELAERCAAVTAAAGGRPSTAVLVDRVPEIETLFRDDRIKRCVERLLKAEVPLTDVGFRCARPGFGEQSLHSDDLPIARTGQCHAVTAIVALCDFSTSNGATAVVPGSHRRPDLQRSAPGLNQRGSGPLPELVLTGTAGTAFVFSAHLLHRGTRNQSSTARPALQAQWRRLGSISSRLQRATITG
jgi:ectoine hydroxylase-related dioxygenase (phytanoyl-CoA dioxygenase family)